MSRPSWSVVVVAKCLIILPSRLCVVVLSWPVAVMCKPLKNLPSRFRRGVTCTPPHTPYVRSAPPIGGGPRAYNGKRRC